MSLVIDKTKNKIKINPVQSKSHTRPMATWLISSYHNGYHPNAKTFQVGVGSKDYYGREQGFEEIKDCCKRRGLLFRDIKKKDNKQ